MEQQWYKYMEQQSLWYKYKTAVWESNSPQTAVIHNIMRVLRAVRCKEMAYVSTPITSGTLYYELQAKSPLLSKKDIIARCIAENYNAGWNFVEKLKTVMDIPIIYPADLVPIHQQWEQAHFQALWLSIIAEKCTELHMSDGWEYSNGCTEELVHTFQLRAGMIPKHDRLFFFNTKESEQQEIARMKSIKIYNQSGAELTVKDGIIALERSIKWINHLGFKAESLENSLGLLRWLV